MKQSRWGSLGETAVNTFAGFGLSLALQWLYFDKWLGFPLHITQNLLFAVIMTAVSLARGFTVRRLAEHFGLRLKLTPAMAAVIAERRRQIEVEGWSEEHDDRHERGELADAAGCYAHCAGADENKSPPPGWPWSSDWWKPRDFRRDLVRAGALILAEIERFDRLRKRHAGAA